MSACAPVRTQRPRAGQPRGRPDLVPYLKKLAPSELAAYCSGVLSAWSSLNAREALEFVHEIEVRKLTEVPVQRIAKRRPLRGLPIHCSRCGVVIPRTGKVGRPVTRHKVCPTDQQLAA